MESDQHPYGPDQRLAVFALEVFRVNGLLARSGERIAAVAGQSAARWQVLGRAHFQPRTVARIARELGLARQSVQTVANALRDDGLIAYLDNPADRRARLVTTTPWGAAVLARIETANETWASRVMPWLSAEDLEQATVLLERIGSAIERDLDVGEEPA
ncbi:MarR family winged helix-turn-helix transcriptional regulator [Microbacterium sp. 22242]|uniref:MarR family winged helix-turn-helix transcriptional regulator n=1 Tax=Microbacterium sp. 22242 TaxID=3453896 RepID=UPI003F86305F